MISDEGQNMAVSPYAAARPGANLISSASKPQANGQPIAMN
jgi:hypothetical protein